MKNTGILCEKNAGILFILKNKNFINRTMKCPRNIVSKLQGRIIFSFSRWLIVSRRTPTCFAKSSCVIFNLARYSLFSLRTPWCIFHFVNRFIVKNIEKPNVRMSVPKIRAISISCSTGFGNNISMNIMIAVVSNVTIKALRHDLLTICSNSSSC